ncbi:Rieske 2Fe-2S domain-containing protein [Ruegeria hyattellae]|uniref:Rieske 2Fe-2S domain-containing protein n=1 Tax=Ruegeria hyattellae TaxID=3233337 RepID=UPI00355B0423
MFQSVNHSKFASDLPRNCTFDENDWRILCNFWHPIAYAHEIQDEPEKARLLDVDLVVYRTSQGVSVARDICPHRGTRLSAGWVRDDNLVCPMHGLCFDHSGQCTKIPSMPHQNAKIPPKMRLYSVLSEERYGIVWACLSGEPNWTLPTWEMLDDPSIKLNFIPSGTWMAAASRHVENFNDLAHFPFVHGGTFGNETPAPLPLYKVHETDYGLTFDMPYLEGGNRFPDGVEADDREVVYTYELTFPFSTAIYIRPVDSDYVQIIADTVCPVSAHESKLFQIITDNTEEPNAEYLVKESSQINEEDKPLVEGQHPEDLPLDLTEEMHIPADRISMDYRRALVKKFGLGAPIAS